VIRGKHLTFNVDAILVFETVIVNEGEHYDPYDGVFVAPQKGVYLFSWTVSGYTTDSCHDCRADAHLMFQSFLSRHDLPFPFCKEQSSILKDDLLHFVHRQTKLYFVQLPIQLQ
jgi:hypothetical protein